MSMDWFRSYHGAPTDPKWRVIAKRAGVRPGDAAAIFWALMDHASQQDVRGDVTHFDVETVSVAFDYEMAQVQAVIDALKEKRIIVDGRLAAWEKRQPKREDNSTERVRKFREAQRNEVKRTETPDKSREEIEEKIPPKAPRKRVATDTPEFIVFWEAYPEKVGKAAARTAHAKALTKADNAALMAGVERYKATKPADRNWCHPSTFLNEERWLDQPAAVACHGNAKTPVAADQIPRRMSQTETYRKWLPAWRDKRLWPREITGTPPPGQPGCAVPPDMLREFGIEVPH